MAGPLGDGDERRNPPPFSTKDAPLRRRSSRARERTSKFASITLLVLALSVAAGTGRARAGVFRQIPNVAGAPANPALIEFDRSVRFYLGFDNPELIADLSTGDGTPSKRPGTVVLEPGLYGRAMLAGKDPLDYRAAGNIDLSRPGALAIWVSAYHWQHPKNPPWFLFLHVSDHGRTLSLARMGTAGNRGAVYAYAGAGRRLVSVISGRSLHWKTSQWHLLVVNWRFQSIEFSLDGRTWHQASLVNTGFAHAEGGPGVLRVGGNAAPAQRCLLDELLVFNRPLTMREIKTLYRLGCDHLRDGRQRKVDGPSRHYCGP